jgi:hypothetical protein
MLRLDVILFAVDSEYVDSRCRRQYVCLRSLLAPRVFMHSESKSDERRFEPMPSLVWQSYFVSMMHPLQ